MVGIKNVWLRKVNGYSKITKDKRLLKQDMEKYKKDGMKWNMIFYWKI